MIFHAQRWSTNTNVEYFKSFIVYCADSLLIKPLTDARGSFLLQLQMPCFPRQYLLALDTNLHKRLCKSQKSINKIYVVDEAVRSCLGNDTGPFTNHWRCKINAAEIFNINGIIYETLTWVVGRNVYVRSSENLPSGWLRALNFCVPTAKQNSHSCYPNIFCLLLFLKILLC